MHGLRLLFAALTFTFSCYATTTQTNDFCKTPPLLENAMLEGWKNETYAQGHSIRYICFPGYVSFGPLTMICNESNWHWKSRTSACRKKSCSYPGSIEFGSFEIKSGDAFEFGAVVEYSCEEGYQMVSRHKTRECTATGWTNTVPKCEERLCPPVRDESLRVLTSVLDEEYTIGQVIRLQCRNSNHRLDGPSEIFCTSNGTWNKNPPKCRGPCILQVDKMKLHNIKLKHQKQDIAHNDVIEFECLPGYAISDPKNLIINCNRGTYPSCHRKEQEKKKVSSCTKPPELLFGELLGEKKQIYSSGSVLHIQCMNYYKLKGKKKIKCKNGNWDDLPTCLEPCVLHNTYIKGNNTRLANASKKYLKHGQSVLLKCLPEFHISDRKLLKVNCTRGKILYPQCVKAGPCTVNENVMKENHIIVKKEKCHGMPERCGSKPIVHNKQVEFTCVPGYSISDPKQLNVTCFGGVITYPKCFNTPDEVADKPLMI